MPTIWQPGPDDVSRPALTGLHHAGAGGASLSPASLPRAVKMPGQTAKSPAIAAPSMEGIFEVLAQIPRERLIQYEHKLSHGQGDPRLCRLLRTMALLTLNQEAEARGGLDALGYDQVAAHIYRSHAGHATADPEPDAEVALAVAQIYALLAEEELCHPGARDEAYRAAVHIFRRRRVDQGRLTSLVDEAREKCGQVFAAALSGDNAGLGPIPSSLEPGSLEPRSLRSTGTPLSFVSHFEISPATTATWGPVRYGEPGADADKSSGSPPDDLGSASDERPNLESPVPRSSPARDDTPSHPSANRSCPPCLPGRDPDARPGQSSPRPPRPCGEPPNVAKDPPAAEGVPPPKPKVPSVPGSLSPGSLKSAEGPSPPKPESIAERRDLPSLGDEPPFFSFVVLHAGEDEGVARRVKDELERLGVPDGATYSEDFLVPGHSQLNCFQEALDNSAFTLLLLTENFGSRLCAYQTSTALMDSFHRFCKSNSVIPFVPKENPISAREMPIALAGLVPLEETSLVFRRRVQNTFTARALREKRAAWQIQARHRQQQRDREYQEMLRRLEELGPPGNPAQCQAPSGPYPPPRYPAPFLPPAGAGPFAPGPDHPSLSQSFLLSASGPQPQFIIQNAQMIQIGDYNQMQAERARPVLGEEAAEE